MAAIITSIMAAIITVSLSLSFITSPFPVFILWIYTGHLKLSGVLSVLFLSEVMGGNILNYISLFQKNRGPARRIFKKTAGEQKPRRASFPANR
jgi:hypothetical protein